jgi:hypothetical protein
MSYNKTKSWHKYSAGEIYEPTVHLFDKTHTDR